MEQETIFTYKFESDNYCRLCEKFILKNFKSQSYCYCCFKNISRQCEKVFANGYRCTNNTYICKKTNTSYTTFCIRCMKLDLDYYAIYTNNITEQIIAAHFNLMHQLNISSAFKYYNKQYTLLFNTNFNEELINKIRKERRLKGYMLDSKEILEKIRMSIAPVNKKNIINFDIDNEINKVTWI